MAATPDIEVPRLGALSVVDGVSGEIRAPRAAMFTVCERPAPEIRSSRLSAFSVGNGDASETRVSKVTVFSIVRGAIVSSTVRAWGGELDQHRFYFLRLGSTETLVWDSYTGQWCDNWQSASFPYWPPVRGWNWLGIAQAQVFGGATSNLVCGDGSSGMLWKVKPEIGTDDMPSGDTFQFDRIVFGGTPARMRATTPCNEVYLTTSPGLQGTLASLSGPNVKLETSDDAGRTWTDQGTVTIDPDDGTQEIVWRSLGIIQAPGRLFRLTDNCLPRIDGLDMR